MVVHPSIPATSVREFIDHTKANPEKIAYASAGAGTTNHLCGALFEKIAKVSMVHVPYRGGAPAVADTVAGQTQLMFTAGTQSLEHVKAGKLRLLAVTEGKRSSLLPDIDHQTTWHHSAMTEIPEFAALLEEIVGSQHHRSFSVDWPFEELTRCSLLNRIAQP
jgi:Tripartite tricarboxylate transporter family receptor